MQTSWVFSYTRTCLLVVRAVRALDGTKLSRSPISLYFACEGSAAADGLQAVSSKKV